VNILIDGLSLYFEEHHKELLSLCGAKPVGIKLVEMRAKNATSASAEQTYAARHKEADDMAKQIQEALEIGTRERYVGQFKQNNQSKRKAAPSADNKSRKAGRIEKNNKKSCCVWWCFSTKNLQSVPLMPPLKEKPTMANRETRAKKVFKRKEFLERLGKNRNDKSLDNTNIRFCGEHPFETVSKTVNVDTGETTIDEGTGKYKKVYTSIPLKVDAPQQKGATCFDSPAVSMSKGNSVDRASLRYLKNISADVNALFSQQQAEMYDVKDGTQELKDISPILLKQSRLDVHDNKENIAGSAKCESKGEKPDKLKASEKLNASEKLEPKILLKEMTAKEVHRRTGFQDIFSLISYVAIVCGGDLDLMTRTSSKLTWLEEWFSFIWR
jgi:hypothetical protein